MRNKTPKKSEYNKTGHKLIKYEMRLCVLYDLDDLSIHDVAPMLKEKVKQYKGYINWRLETEFGYSAVEVNLIADRWETDKEKTARLRRSELAKKSAAKRKTKLELEEIELYEKLKAKYSK